MRKKVVLGLLLATVLAGGAFAQISLSAGGGGTFTADFLRINDLFHTSYYTYSDFTPTQIHTDYIGGGFYAYFDATYVMVSLGMSFFDVSPADSALKKALKDAKTNTTLTTFDIGLLGKLPIRLGRATLFPMLGVDIKIAVAYNATYNGIKLTYDGDVGEDLSTVWFKFGVGGDIPLGQNLYLRPMFLYGLGTVPKAIAKNLDANGIYYSYAEIGGSKIPAKSIYHGLDVKLAVGYKFDIYPRRKAPVVRRK